MQKKNTKILFLYFGNHWFHRKLARELKATSRSAILTSKAPNSLLKPFVLAYRSINLPDEYSTYLCEDTYMFPAFRKMFFGLKKTKIINITAGSLMYYLVKGKINPVLKPAYVYLMRYVDLFVCVSELEQQLVKELYPNAKTVVVNPYIKYNLRKKLLSKALPRLENHNVIVIAYGHSVYYKGIDIAVEAFKKVKQRWEDATLTIVGKWDNNTIRKYSAMARDIKFTGYVKDISSEIRKASISIHLARGEGFGINIIETMLAGVPTIVSRTTGARDAVKLLNHKFIVPLNATVAAKTIDEYFQLDPIKKNKLSRKARQIASRYTEQRCINKFKKNLEGFI